MMLKPLFGIICVLVILSCKEETPDSGAGPDVTPQANKPDPGQPSEELTNYQLTKFGREVASLAQSKDLEKLNALFDDESLWKMASQGLLVSPQIEKALSSRYHQVIKRPGGLMADLSPPGSSLYFVGVTTFQGSRYPVLRMEIQEIFDYFLLDLSRDAQDKLLINRTYSVNRGDWLTAGYRRILIEHYHSMKGDLNELNPNDKLIAQHFGDILKINQAAIAGQPGKANKIYSQLPRSLASQNWVRKVYLGALKRDQKLHLEAVDKFQQEAPDDATVALLTLPVSLDAGRLNNVSIKVDLLDQFTGGDPYLNYFRYIIARVEDETDLALGFIRQAAHSLPNHRMVNQCYLTMLNRTKNFDEMSKQMIAMATNLGIGIPKKTLLENPVYREFSESPAGKDLIKKLR